MKNKTVERKNDRLMAMAPGKLRVAANSISDPGLRAVFLRLAARVEQKSRESGAFCAIDGLRNSAPECPAK